MNPESPIAPTRPSRRTWGIALLAVAVIATTAGCGSTATEGKAALTASPHVSKPPRTGAERPSRDRLDALGSARARKLASEADAIARQQKRLRANPLATHPWGVYQGPREPSWVAYSKAGGTTKQVLAAIAQEPKAVWFTTHTSAAAIAGQARDYIALSQHGDPNALVQMALFNMRPWEHEACRRLPSASEQASYRAWIGNLAGAIGSTPTAIILQPDGPFALCAPRHSRIPSDLIAFAARTLSALPHTSVYVEAGAADWPAAGAQGGAGAAADLLIAGGVRYARGFALNGTHYSATSAEIARGAAINAVLRARGIGAKHFVINTTQNGHPFVFGNYRGGDPDNATVCPSRTVSSSATCTTLGIPPTTDVANPRWGLSTSTAEIARRWVDGYMWFGRPWLVRQAWPFSLSRALQLVRSSPWL